MGKNKKTIVDRLLKELLNEFMDKWGMNYIVDPSIKFDEIPEPYRYKLFKPFRRKKGDPIGWEKNAKGKVVEIK